MRKPLPSLGRLRLAWPALQLPALAVASVLFCCDPAEADVFVLEGQAEIHGQLVNRDESPRTSYVIKTASGGQITLDADQVKDVHRQSDLEMRYDRYRGQAPDTVEGQWKMAEWCRQNRLLKERKVHLARIIELDPDHSDARHALGYSNVGGRWVTQEQQMIENGYVRSKFAPGKWVLPQEEELLQRRDATTRAQLEWNAKLKRYSGWLSTDKAPQAVAGIQAIDDPSAIPALAKHLESETRRDVRLLYIAALSRIKTPAALDVLVNASLFDADAEIRLNSLEEVVNRDYRPAVRHFVQGLKHKDNAIINRAAIGLGRMKDTSAVGPLIDALVTTHTFRIQQGQPGQTSTTFGTGPNSGGFSMGGSGVKIVKQQFRNPDVLQALVSLAGGVSYNYDNRAWKNWFVGQKKPNSLDARRDTAN